MIRRRRAVALLAFAATAFVRGAVGHAQAAAVAPEDARINKAFEACQTGNVQVGIELLTQLYSETQDPDLVTAQALCFDKNGRHAEAAKLYREYLRIAPNAPAEDRAAVEAKLQSAESADRPPPAVAVPLPPPALDPAPPPSAPSAVVIQTTPEPARPSLILPLVLAGTGAAALVAGGVLYLAAGNAVDDYKACDHVCTKTEIDSRANHVKQLDRASAVTAAVGATLAAAGVVIILERRHATHEGPTRAAAGAPSLVLSLGSVGVSVLF